MRFGMALIKNEHGVLHVLRKVPKGLEVPAARVMGAPKERVSWLKETSDPASNAETIALWLGVIKQFGE